MLSPRTWPAKVYNDIIRDGRVVRGSIGVSFKSDVQASTLEAFGLDHGVMVDVVAEGGPAGKAGLQADDIITALNDKPVKDGPDLINHVADMSIGSLATITVDRNGKRADFKVAIGERSQVWKGSSQVTEYEPKEATSVTTSNKTPAVGKFGIAIQRLTEKERQDLAIQDKTGVKVVSVDPGSFADDIGMLDGDTILSINRTPVSTPDDVIRAQAGFKPGQPIAVHVARTSGKHVEAQRLYLSGRMVLAERLARIFGSKRVRLEDGRFGMIAARFSNTRADITQDLRDDVHSASGKISKSGTQNG